MGGCKVTAVEYNEPIAKIYQDFFPEDTVIVGDAHQYLLDHSKEFDFIWGSPPCPTHSKLRLMGVNIGQNKPVYPDMALYQEIIFIDYHFKGKYCIENVDPYYDLLIPGKKSGRHIFWTNFNIGKLQTSHLPIKGETNLTWKDREQEHGMIVKNWHGFKGDKGRVFKNCVDPRQGLYILNCARNIITKQNTSQTSLFE